MTVTSAQVTTLLENVLFESATLAKANATQVTAYANLSSSTSTVAGLSAFLATQPEATIAEQVVRYYQGALGRVPAPVEIAYYVAIAEANMTPSQIAEGVTAVNGGTWAQIADYFAASPEFKADFGLTGTGTPNQALVITGFYHNILGRAPSAAEITYYEGLLNSGTSYSTLVQYFTESPEYQALADTTIASNLAAAGTTAVTTVAAGGNPLTSTTPIGSLPVQTGSSAALSFNSASPTYVAGVTVAGTAGSSSNTLSLNDGGSVAAPGGTPINLSLPAGASISNIQTVNINGSGTDALTFNASTAAWSSVAAINITSGGAQTIVAGAGASVTSIDTLDALGFATSIDGGSAITLTATGATGAAGSIGEIDVGVNTAPTGAVSITARETITNTNGSLGNIVVGGGVGVTVNSTVNDGVALNASTGSVASVPATGTAATISVTGSGAVVVNNALNVTSTGTIATFANAVIVNGGSTITVNETVSASQSAVGVSSVTEGTVAVAGDTTTTSVTVNQAAVGVGALASAASAGTSYTSAVSSTSAAPGVGGVTKVSGTAYSAASAAVTGTPTVTADGAVTIADANYNTSKANTITSVTLSNFSAGATISDNALTTLSLSGTGGVVQILNAGAVLGTPTTTTGTLTLDVSSLSGTTLDDTNADIKTLDIVTAGKASTLAVGADAHLTTVAVSGTAALTLSSFPASVSAVTVTGSAGLTAAITDTTTTFTSTSTGASVITLAGDATKAITGNGSDEVILSAAPGTYNATSGHLFNTNVTGFSTLGISETVGAETYDLSTFNSGFKALDVETTKALTFINVAAGTTLSLSGADTVVYQSADTSGATDSATVNLNAVEVGIAVAGLTLEDANGNAYGTVNIVSNVATSTGVFNTIAAGSFDSAVGSLTVSGSAGLHLLGTWAETTTSLSLTNNVADPAAETGGTLLVTTLTDDALGNISFAGTSTQGGTYATTITTLNDTVANLTLTNTSAAPVQIGLLAEGASATTTVTLAAASTGSLDIAHLTTTSAAVKFVDASSTATLTIGDGGAADFADASLATLTLSGNVALGTDNGAAATATGVTTGFTLSGSTDNAHVNFTIGASTGTDTITLGNGNDQITDGNTTGTANVTLGTGFSIVDLHAGTTSTGNTVTLGAHTSTSSLFDEVLVGKIAASSAAPNYVLTGLVANDQVVIASADTAVALSATVLANAAAASTLGAALLIADAAVGANDAAVFAWGNNTYLISSAGAGNGTLTANDSFVELVGTHTLTLGALTSGHIVLAS